MMKPLHAEKTDLRQELRLLSLLFFLFFLFDLSFAQVPINGFCKLNTFSVDSGYNFIFRLNFNTDSYSDIILSSSFDKRSALLEGFGIGEFKDQKKITLPLSTSNIEPIFNRINEIEGYAFLSRAERTFGIYSFSQFGHPSISKQYKFNSYPDRISIADINGDEQNEFLISGSTFDGLSLLSLQENKFVEEKLIEKTSFSFAHFIDLNNDGFKDIAAYNLFNSNIHFLFNDGEGVFTEVRTLPYFDQATQFRTFDFNYDSYNDLILSSINSIKIFFGDFRSAYDSAITINTLYPVDDFVIGDLNQDGYFDIVYLSKESGIISSVFGKPDGNFYKEFVHLKRERIESVVLYISKFIYGVAFLTEKGEVGLISKLSSVTEDFDLAVSVEPVAITSFDIDRNKILDIAFFDKSNNTLNLLLRNKDGIPNKFYSATLFGEPEFLVVDDSKSDEKKFYCYSNNSRLIEIITFDLPNDNIKREQLYSPGNLLDLKIYYTDKNNSSIYIAYRKENKFYFGEVKYHNIRYSFSEYYSITEKWVDAEIIPLDKPILLYWKTEKGQLNLIELLFNIDKPGGRERQTIPLQRAEIFSSSDITKQKDSYKQVSIILTGERDFISIVSANNANLINADKQLSGLRIKNKNHLSFDGRNSVFFYDGNKKSIRKIELSPDNKRAGFLEIFNNIEATDFIIVNPELNNLHLIYLNKENGSISVRHIQ